MAINQILEKILNFNLEFILEIFGLTELLILIPHVIILFVIIFLIKESRTRRTKSKIHVGPEYEEEPEPLSPRGSLPQEPSEEPSEEYESSNPNFTNRHFDFESGLEKVVEIVYENGHKVDVRLFLSKNSYEIFSRNYKMNVGDNYVRFIIQVSTRTSSKLISGGNFEFNDDFSKGYTLFVIMKYADSKLISMISNILRAKNFGCLPSKYSIHAHLNDKYPNEDSARKLVSEIALKLKENLHTVKTDDNQTKDNNQ